MALLEKPGVKVPRGGTAVLHDCQDSVVPLGDVERSLERAREVTRGLPWNEGISLTLQDGEHEFDCSFRVERP